MFKHQKKLLHPVKVKKPNPTYAALLQEQLGGPQGEMKAAMQYFAQSLRIQDKEIKDLFLDIAAEELCHMEIVAEMINQLNGDQLNAKEATVGGNLLVILSGFCTIVQKATILDENFKKEENYLAI